MPITLSKIANTTFRSGIILRGREATRRVIDAHLKGCGNTILCPTSTSRVDFPLATEAEAEAQIVQAATSVPPSAAWRMLEQGGRAAFLTLHPEAKACLLEIDWFDRAEETAR